MHKLNLGLEEDFPVIPPRDSIDNLKEDTIPGVGLGEGLRGMGEGEGGLGIWINV